MACTSLQRSLPAAAAVAVAAAAAAHHLHSATRRRLPTCPPRATSDGFLKGLPLAVLLGCHGARIATAGSFHPEFRVVAMAPKKKVNAYDDNWNKQWFGAGIFVENTEVVPVNIIRNLEKKKLLTQVEKAGLLSKAENAGLTLSSIEKMGLLSKAENLGLLSLAENFVTTSPATLASFSLPFFIAAILAIVVVPDDSTVLVIARNTLVGLFALGAGGLFVGSVILSGLQEE